MQIPGTTMKSKKEVTIYDIANELKVSPSTVSRALKGHYSIGKDTIKAVRTLAKQKGYRPNAIAASLRSSKTNTIGIIISWVNRPFVSSLISGIEQLANKEGYNVFISQSHDNYENEIANAQALYDSRVSGLVVSLAMETKQYDHFMPFVKKNIPVVFVDRVCEEINSDKVIVDNFAAGFAATKHLIDQGCRRIAHISGAQHRNVYAEREKGYIAALKKNNLPIDETLILHSDILSAEEGYNGARNLMSLPEPPDAIFAASDNAAVSVIQLAKDMNISVPHELAVIGFNNDPVSLIIDPQLSTISHPAVDMGIIAARQVLKHKENKDMIESETVILKTELIVRASSLKKKD